MLILGQENTMSTRLYLKLQGITLPLAVVLLVLGTAGLIVI